jgi:hypothetical protein
VRLLTTHLTNCDWPGKIEANGVEKLKGNFMDFVVQTINDLHDEIVATITASIEAVELATGSFIWKQVQDIAGEDLHRILQREFPRAEIIVATSKSSYPDVKLILNEMQCAIDIKSAKIQRSPSYDMGRLENYEEDHFCVYLEEWELLVQYDEEAGRLTRVFFAPVREFVGYSPRCDGVTFRLYDGQIRPKIWSDFINEVVYWPSPERFIEGVRNSLNYSQMLGMRSAIPNLTPAQKAELRLLLDAVEFEPDEEDL